MVKCAECGLMFPGNMVGKSAFICWKCFEKIKFKEHAALPKTDRKPDTEIHIERKIFPDINKESIPGMIGGVPDISREIMAHVTQIAQETNDRFIFETVSTFLSRQLGGISISKADLLHAMQARRKLAPYYEDGEYRCKACGHVVRHNADVTDKYCPNCGQYNGLSATVPYSAKECAMEKQAKQAANELWAALEYFKTGRE